MPGAKTGIGAGIGAALKVVGAVAVGDAVAGVAGFGAAASASGATCPASITYEMKAAA